MQVPTKESLMDSGKTGAIDGGSLAVGELMGRALLGRGAGTAVGGIVAAAAAEGNSRDTLATIAVERAANEIQAGSGA